MSRRAPVATPVADQPANVAAAGGKAVTMAAAGAPPAEVAAVRALAAAAAPGAGAVGAARGSIVVPIGALSPIRAGGACSTGCGGGGGGAASVAAGGTGAGVGVGGAGGGGGGCISCSIVISMGSGVSSTWCSGETHQKASATRACNSVASATPVGD